MLLCFAPAPVAMAGGYDTPMLYTARHMGMGGTAVSYVNDPSALFHNPAGLANIEGSASFIGDLSLLVGDITASPTDATRSITSNPTIAPFFLVGGAGKVELSEDFSLAFGAAVYPVASAAASYEYDRGGTPFEDSTTLLFIEAAPGVAVELFDQLTIGASWRVTYVSLDRRRAPADGDPLPGTGLDFSGTGFSFTGFRVGAQWEAVEDHLSVGIHYRHRTDTTITNDSGFAIAEVTDLESEFILPGRISAGVRGDFYNFGVAFDFEYGFQSQNDSVLLSGTFPTGDRIGVPNIFEWQDAITLRVGGEYNIDLGDDMTLTPRIGFIYDAKTSTEQYPTAFGTPPAPTYVGTAGLGFDGGAWEVNVAGAYRAGGTTVAVEPMDRERSCQFCGFPGDYSLGLGGFYVDFSYDLE